MVFDFLSKIFFLKPNPIDHNIDTTMICPDVDRCAYKYVCVVTRCFYACTHV